MKLNYQAVMDQVNDAKTVLANASAEQLMKYRQEQIVACGAFTNDCNGAGILHIQQDAA